MAAAWVAGCHPCQPIMPNPVEVSDKSCVYASMHATTACHCASVAHPGAVEYSSHIFSSTHVYWYVTYLSCLVEQLDSTHNLPEIIIANVLVPY